LRRTARGFTMKAVVLVGGLTTTMRPLTLTLPLPLLPFANKALIMHQLQALKEAGATEVIFCINARTIPKVLTEAIEQGAVECDVKVAISQEKEGFGTAGSLKFAEALITANGTNTAPFFVVNSDVLCSYPLRDLLHVHMKSGRLGTLLVTRSQSPSKYGVAVIDERTGMVKHFVANPQTFMSDVVTAGVYVFSPSIFEHIKQSKKVSMNEVLPRLAADEQLHSMLLTGYWVKITDAASYMDAVGSHLEIMRFMSPASLLSAPTAEAAGYVVHGDVMVHESASVAKGCELGPRVVIGPHCVVQQGVRLEDVTLLEGATVCAHSLVKRSLIGWRSTFGKWCFVEDSLLGEEVEVSEALLVKGATILPHKELTENIRKEQIVI